MNTNKISNLLLIIPVSISLIFSVQIVRAEKTSNNKYYDENSVETVKSKKTETSQNVKKNSYASNVLQTDSLKEKIHYSAKDSTRSSNKKSIILLFGKATFSCANFDLKAEEIIFNKKTQKVTAKDFTIFYKQNKTTNTGSYGEFYLNSKN